MGISAIRKKVSICNIVIAALCFVAILCYFIFPFWRVSLSLTLSPENMEELLNEELGDEDITMQNGDIAPTSTIIYTNTPSIEDEVNKSEINFEDLDLKKILGDEEVVISAGISLSSGDIVGSLFIDPHDTVENILKSNVDDIVDQLDETLNKIAKNAATQVSAMVLKEQVKSEIRALYDTDKTDEEVQQLLDDAGITDEYIESKTEQIVNSLYEENANTETVSETIVSTVDDVCKTLKNSGNPDFADLTLSNEDKEEIKTDIQEILNEIAEEDGSINGEEIVSRLVLGLLQDANEESEEGVQPSAKQYGAQAQIKPLSASASDEELSEEDVKEQLKAEIYKMLEVPEEAVETIAVVLRVLAALVLIILLSWLYIIIKILCKMKKPDNSVKLKCPMFLGWWPFAILHALPTILFSMLADPTSPLGELVGAEATEMFKFFSVDFFSSAVIAFVIAVGLFFFAAFYYRKLRRTLKDAIMNGEKVEDITEQRSFGTYTDENVTFETATSEETNADSQE